LWNHRTDENCVFHDIGAARQERLLFEIVEHAYSRHEKVLIFVQNEERAAAMDRVLWILKQEAFIPHKVLNSQEIDSTIPVAIVTTEFNPIEAGILIADGHCSIEFACRFDSVHEFVNRSSPEIQKACRERYRIYRERHVPVKHVKE
jgi:DNA polymerase-3 subunit chi